VTSHFIPPDRQQSADLVLRSPLPGDGEALASALNGSYEHLHRFLPWAKPVEDPIDCETRCRRFRARYLLNEDFVIFVLSDDETRILGGSGFHLRGGSIDDHRAEIGMWIGSGSATSGVGTRALIEMLRWGFSVWPFYRLCWKCSTENLASRRVAEKAGMILDCTERRILDVSGESSHDQMTFVAFREEWTPPEPS